jgi:hypothetical protein
MKNLRKANLRRTRITMNGLRKFLVPPEILIFRELRRLELMERQLPMAILSHHVD